MKIVLDTNVLFSAFVSNGACHTLMEHGLLYHDLFLSTFILNELEKNLAEKTKLTKKERAEVGAELVATTNIVEPIPLLMPVCRDPDNDMILATAKMANADCIITGDQDLLELKNYEGVAILSPKDFWAFEATRQKYDD